MCAIAMDLLLHGSYTRLSYTSSNKVKLVAAESMIPTSTPLYYSLPSYWKNELNNK